VTALLADDNWGNLMAVLPADRRRPKAGGIYYHADCERPHRFKYRRAYRQMWETLAHTSGSTRSRWLKVSYALSTLLKVLTLSVGATECGSLIRDDGNLDPECWGSQIPRNAFGVFPLDRL
jgi:hypothetical protein